jgi:ABC-type transporter Mla subunit MlaD
MIEANRRTAIVVGAFVAVVGLLGAALLVFIGVETPWQRRVPLEARLADASGLRTGGWVQLAGVNVGIVRRIDLDDAARGGAHVSLRVDPRVPARLHADAAVELRTIGLLGDRVVALEPGRSPDPFRRGQVLEGRPVVDPGVLIEKAGRLADRAGGSLERIDRMLAGFEASGAVRDMAAAAAALRATAERARRGPGLLHTLAWEPALGDDVRASARRLDRSTAAMERAAGDLEAVAKQVRSGQGTVGGLIYDPAIYESLRTIVGNVARSRLLRALVRFSFTQRERPPAARPPKRR